MPEEEATAARICAYWNAVVLDRALDGVPLETDLAETIQRLHTLNIEAPNAARDRVREVLRASIERHQEGANPMSSSMLTFPHSSRATPSQVRSRGVLPTPNVVNRGRFSTLAVLTILLLALATVSVPFLSSRMGRPSNSLVIIPAITQPDPPTPAAVEEITGGDDPLTAPAGIAVGADGTLYVIDVPRDHIRVFNADGSPRATWGTSGDGAGEFGFSFDFPWGDVAIAPNGNLYVLDPNLARIQAFRPDGTFLFEFGERGSEEGQILYPMGIGIGPDGQVYVADWQNHRVSVFAGDGTYLASWDGSTGEGTPLAAPKDVAVTPDGTVWVTDEVLQKIIGFAPDGTVIGTIGKIGDEPGELRGPWGIATDATGNLYVAEYDNDRVQGFAPDRGPLGTVGATGSEPGQLTAPTYLAIGPDGSLYVTEESATRVQRFAPDALIPPNLLLTTEPGT